MGLEVHTEYVPFINSQLAGRNIFQGLIECKLDDDPLHIFGEQSPRSPPRGRVYG